MSYFNTTHEKDTSKYLSSNVKQEDIILGIFNKEIILSPSQVLNFYPGVKPPLTSIRRAITCLTEKGKLVKTDRKHEGNFGRSEYCWKIKTGQINLF